MEFLHQNQWILESDLQVRPRRNRAHQSLRFAVRETTLSPSNLVLPLFIKDDEGGSEEIKEMQGCRRLTIDDAVEVVRKAKELGIMGIALFPKISDNLKDKTASESLNLDGILPKCVRKLKEEVPGILIITDVAMDPYSSDGHDGYVREDGVIDNDVTLNILCKMAIVQAKAGADCVAPSDMMDGRIGAIRRALDLNGFSHVLICSYAAKYCSSFYGPFRFALDSAPRGGDKKTYQMDIHNSREAIREIKLDEKEGADWLMVKPGLPYLDVVKTVKENTHLPVAVYHVSGEFAMLKCAAIQGLVDYRCCLMESLISMRRAGASIIFTYGAIDAATFLKEQHHY